MYYDPYDSDVQIKFHRTDPTGRWSPIHETEERSSTIAGLLGGVVFALVLITLLGAFL